MMEERVLELRDVSLIRDGVSIVKRCSASFPQKGLYVIIGPSGAGKTTLLMLLSGLVSPSSGAVLYRGTSLHDMDLPSYRSKVVLQFQEPPPFPGSARDNLLIPFGLEHHREETPTEADIRGAITRCMLKEHVLGHDMETLSGGEKQRLALARTLLLTPTVYLLDEPTSALDAATQGKIVSLLADLSSSALVICVTHSQELAAKADGIVNIDGGQMRHYSGISPAELTRLMGDQSHGD